jgi:hypothetical protein
LKFILAVYNGKKHKEANYFTAPVEIFWLTRRPGSCNFHARPRRHEKGIATARAVKRNRKKLLEIRPLVFISLSLFRGTDSIVFREFAVCN